LPEKFLELWVFVIALLQWAQLNTFSATSSIESYIKRTNQCSGFKRKPRTESRMAVMSERRNARRYDLTLPISIRLGAERIIARQEGKTRDISTRGLYFVVQRDFDAGSELDITLTLPAAITHGTDVFVRAQGKVVRVERRLEDGEERMGVAAVIERYDIIRDQTRVSTPSAGV
jgi:hypothetical protein